MVPGFSSLYSMGVRAVFTVRRSGHFDFGCKWKRMSVVLLRDFKCFVLEVYV